MLTAVNLVLAVTIFVLGYIGYTRYKSKGRMPLYIAIAFGLFGISHLATLLGLADTLNIILIIVRTLGYLTVIYALYSHLTQ